MKKIAILVAGILMAFNLYAAEDLSKESKEKAEEIKEEIAVTAEKVNSGWDFSGTNVEYVHTFMDSVSDTNYSGKDIDLILKVKKNIDSETWISAKYDTDDSNPDKAIEILVNRKFGKYLEAQVDLDFITSNKVDNKEVGGIELREDNDSAKSFIKYMATDNLTLKFAPFDIDLSMGTELDTDTQPVIPGVQADYVINGKVSVYAGMGSKTERDLGKDKDVTAYGFKAGVSYTPSTEFNLTAAFSGANEPEEELSTTPRGKVAANLTASYKIGKVGIDVEGAFIELNRKIELGTGEYSGTAGTGLYGKVSYEEGKIANVDTTPYVKLKNYSENFYFYDDDSFQNVNHGGLTIASLGVDLTTLRGLTITPEVEFRTAKNAIYGGEKSATFVTTTVSLKF